MAKYFSFFPKTPYSLNESGSLDFITNLTTSFSVDDTIKNNVILYYQYDIADDESPDIVAAKLYGASDKHWIILKTNDIYSVKDQWPLSSSALFKHIDSKYEEFANTLTSQTGYEWADSNIQSYYEVRTKIYPNFTELKDVEKIQVDANTYANVVTGTTNVTLPPNNTTIQIVVTKEQKTYVQYEQELNENKRSIKILKPELVTEFEKEFQRVITNE